MTPRVLIVEDEPRLRDLLTDTLPDMGFVATATRSAEEAQRVMTADPHDILLLDLHLPQMSGLDLLESLRPTFPTTPALILTAYGDLPAARRAIHLDVTDFLSKPFHLSDLEQALDRARRKLPGPLPTATDTTPAPLPASTLAESEHHQILAALRRHHNNKSATAAELGISRRTLHYRLADYRARGLPTE